MRTLWITLANGLLLLLTSTAAGADETNPSALLKDSKRVVFLGDSITAAGQYVAFLNAWIVAQRWESSPQFINCGLPSETVSGLSEEGHAGGKFPRPDLAERLDRVLALTKPDLVIACYGINCGIYQPFAEERFQRYRQGMEQLRMQVDKAGAKLIVITPPFYDDQRSPKPFSYNGVLDRYSDWLVKQRGNGWLIIDLHSPMTSEVQKHRMTNPEFTFQPDGVHPNEDGHWYIAQQVIRWFGDEAVAADKSADEMLKRHNMPAELLPLVKQRMSVLRDAYVAGAGHKRPGVAAGLPVSEAEKNAAEINAGIAKVLAQSPAQPALPQPTLVPPFQAVDLNVGESQEVLLAGQPILVKLLELKEQRDSLRGAVRRAEVRVEVARQTHTLVSATYHLPVKVGPVQIDCPITAGYTRNSTKTTGGLAPWGLEKDARLRLWPADSPWINPDTFQYPAKQAWFASATQMANEPTYVDGGEKPGTGSIYYHYGLDIGGAEGLVDVVAATDGLVVSVGKEALPGYEDTPVAARYDVIYLLDERGWFYRYSHLHTIAAGLKPGQKVRRGQPLGILGKEGGSGGWSHLHFDISGRQPSGKWGIIDGYAFLWEANHRERKPQIVAVARPHQFAAVGEQVQLDGSRSWSAAGPIAKYQWTCTDGQTASGATWERTYSRPGVYSEILQVTDSAGRIDYDFATVNIVDREHPEQLPPSIHAAFAPTENIQAGEAVKFLVRTFRTTDGEESWDFGDGTPPVVVQSDGNVVQLAKDGYAQTVHRFGKPGTYLVRVQRTDRHGFTATGRLKVVVGQ